MAVTFKLLWIAYGMLMVEVTICGIHKISLLQLYLDNDVKSG